MNGTIGKQTYTLPGPVESEVAEKLDEWSREDKARLLWEKDASLWTDGDEDRWLGWLGVTGDWTAQADELESMAGSTSGKEGRSLFTHALLLGMGGSSLCPEVLAATFGRQTDSPGFYVLDSTDPAQVRAVEERIDLASTLFIVSSKSGSTLEPDIFRRHFFSRVEAILGEDAPGERFMAITDPGSALHQVAERDRYRHIFFGVPSVGGRYSALTSFGLVPGEIIGLDQLRFMGRVEEMIRACSPDVDPRENPGVVLGITLGVLAGHGRDKVTIITSPGIEALGAWLEQLLAESTGKEGKGLIPVDLEEPGPPEVYGTDRIFVYGRLESAADPVQDAAVEALEKAGHPVVRISVGDVYDLGQEFFRWEMATAVAGSVMGINPFNQPDVEASKVAARKLTDRYEETGELPAESPILEDRGLKLFTDGQNAAILREEAGDDSSLKGYLRAHLNRLGPGDYFAILAYIQRTDSHQEELQAMRHAVRDNKGTATCLGYGPRFLHSTGQVYKGGPNTGVFLQITCDDAADLPVPGRKYTFGVVKAAQARGDLEVLAGRDRRALRIHLGSDVEAGLATLGSAVREVLSPG